MKALYPKGESGELKPDEAAGLDKLIILRVLAFAKRLLARKLS